VHDLTGHGTLEKKGRERKLRGLFAFGVLTSVWLARIKPNS
jgi:hypothetical protein